MIPRRELDQLRSEWSLDIGVIEKDYVLGWLLAAIAAQPELSQTWVFKGGTCLRKCYYETFRFSEDLDFTVINGGPEEPGDLQPIFIDVAEWLREECGILLQLDDKAFTRRKNLRGRPTTQGKIAYRGPNETRGVPPKVKFDLTSDERVTQRPELRPIGHDYSDHPLPVRGVRTCLAISSPDRYPLSTGSGANSTTSLDGWVVRDIRPNCRVPTLQTSTRIGRPLAPSRHGGVASHSNSCATRAPTA